MNPSSLLRSMDVLVGIPAPLPLRFWISLSLRLVLHCVQMWKYEGSKTLSYYTRVSQKARPQQFTVTPDRAAALAAQKDVEYEEPCAMCSGAIYWAGIGRMVYALPEQALIPLTGNEGPSPRQRGWRRRLWRQPRRG